MQKQHLKYKVSISNAEAESQLRTSNLKQRYNLKEITYHIKNSALNNSIVSNKGIT